MKLIRILTDDKKSTGQFFDFESFKEGLSEEKCYKEIENISSSNIIAILEYILENDETEFDLFDDEKLQNPAQKIIYKELSKNLQETISKRKDILKEVDDSFSAIERKYSIE